MNEPTINLAFDNETLKSAQEDCGVELYFGNRYIKAPVCVELPEEYMMYERAAELAANIKIESNVRYNVIVGGNFIFGDFIEAFIANNNAKCSRVMISTLSMSENNVDSLANLLDGGFVDRLDLIVSDHFYSHERHGLIPYLYRVLDKGDKFQLATAGSHTKICLISTLGGKHIVIHGSANLRSSSNIEQFVVEENRKLYDFWIEYHDRIIDKYKTINKSIRGKELWRVVAKKAAEEDQKKVQPQRKEKQKSMTQERHRSNLAHE